MPPHNPMYKPPTRAPPPPPPSQHHNAAQVPSTSAPPPPPRQLPCKKPPAIPHQQAPCIPQEQQTPKQAPPTRPQHIPPPMPSFYQEKQVANSPIKSPTAKNPYQSNILSPTSAPRKLSVTETSPMIVTSSSVSMFSPNVTSSAPSPSVFSPAPLPPPVATRHGKPTLGPTPSLTSPPVRPPVHCNSDNVLAEPPRGPKHAPPPAPPARTVKNPLASSATIMVPRPQVTSSPLAVSSPAVPSSPMIASSPMYPSSPMIASSPMTASSPSVRTPNPPPVPPRTRPAGLGSTNNQADGSDNAEPPATSHQGGVNLLKVSVGIMRNEGNSPHHVYPQSPSQANNSGDYQTSLNNLKRQTHLLKSPMIKDYLNRNLLSGTQSAHNSPVTKRSATARRSVTPPPTRPDNTETLARLRKLSDPVAMQCNHLQRRVELLGSEDGISMPYNVTHTTHINLHNFDILAKDSNYLLLSQSNIPENEKSGHLFKLAGANFKERWFVCKESTLTYYTKKTDVKPRGEIFLGDCEFTRDKQNKRLHTLHLYLCSTKKHYYLSAMSNDVMEQWVRVLHQGGAVDKDFVTYEQSAREKEKKAEEARKVRELRKQENDYVKAKFKNRSALKLTNKNMPDGLIRDCLCQMHVAEVKMSEGRIVFRVDITFDDQQWTIFRKYDKVIKLYSAVAKLKFTKRMCPPKKAPSSMLESQFSKLQVEKLQELLDTLSQNRSLVLASASVKQAYLRFIAPVGWDDIKADDFVMPFVFEL